MPTIAFDDDAYREAFNEERGAGTDTKRYRALERALDIRKFEIDLYWKRATYFWTFIAATLAGFVAIQASQAVNKTDLSVLLCNLGIVFSYAWFCVNRGSKYWQENWEYHVDMLEDLVHGPLYKVVLSRRAPKKFGEYVVDFVTGPSPISVSKVNHLISLFVTIMWVGLLVYSLPPFELSRPLDWHYVGIIALSATSCIAFTTIGKTYSGGYWHRGAIRTASIENDPPPR
jgi:hypothetical protein